MASSVAELVAVFKGEGASTAMTQLLATGASFDRTGLAAKAMGEASSIHAQQMAQALGGVAPAAANAGASLESAGARAEAASSQFKMMAAIGAVVLIAALATVGVKAGEMAGNYEAAVTRLFTTAGEQKSA